MSLVIRLPSLTPRRTAEKYMSIVVVYLAQRPKKQEIQRHVQNPNVENWLCNIGY